MTLTEKVFKFKVEVILKKGVLDPFTSAFATIPGVSTLGAVGQTLFNKTFFSNLQIQTVLLINNNLSDNK